MFMCKLCRLIMSLEVLSTDNDSQYVFVAKIYNSKHVVNLLKTIHFKDVATVLINESGIKITVEDGKCVQGNAFLQADLFQEYNIKEEFVSFCIHLPTFISCLDIFGSGNSQNAATAMKMCYRNYGCPLILVLEDSGIVTDCRLPTQDVHDILDFDFSSDNVVNKIIMKSDALKEAWGDLDATSDVLEMLLSPNKPFFRLTTNNTYGNVQISFDRDSEANELFQCTQTQANRYRMSLLKPTLKALAASMKISMRTDDRGFLCLQYMIRLEDDQTCFVEYMCCPEEDVT